MKKKFITLTITLGLLIATAFIGGFIFRKTFIDRETIQEVLAKYDCMYKGNKCALENIINGMLLSIPVNNTTNFDFYVLNDTDTTVTLISKDNLVSKSDWSISSDSDGPIVLFEKLNSATKDWSNIEPIEEYYYEDYGYKNYSNACTNSQTDEQNTYCNYTGKKAFYKKVNIANGNVYITTAQNDLLPLNISSLKARPVTLEEILTFSFSIGNQIPSWLCGDADYWTLSSAIKNNEFNNAYAVSNNANLTESNLIIKNVSNGNNSTDTGIRAVITLDKI